MKFKTLLALPLMAALAFGFAGVTTAVAQDNGYDEQQWWNPGDWFDDTPNTWTDDEYGYEDTWDYSYDWGDNEWYDENYGAGFGEDMENYGTGYGYGADEDTEYYEDEGLFDDWGTEWEDNYDYDNAGLFE